MRISPKQYAMLLYELTRDMAENEVDRITQQFLVLLLKNRDFALLPKIQLLYKNYYNVREGVTDIEIITAREVSKNTVSFIKEFVNVKNINLEMKIDKNVIGGAAIKVGDYMIDDTLKTRINTLKQNLRNEKS